MNEVTKSDVIKYLHRFIKQANEEQLRDLVCSTFSPRCSFDCPLRNKENCECNKIIME